MAETIKNDSKPVPMKVLVLLVFLALFPFAVLFIWFGITMDYIYQELDIYTKNLPDYLFYGGLIIIFATLECVVLMGWVINKLKKQ